MSQPSINQKNPSLFSGAWCSSFVIFITFNLNKIHLNHSINKLSQHSSYSGDNPIPCVCLPFHRANKILPPDKKLHIEFVILPLVINTIRFFYFVTLPFSDTLYVLRSFSNFYFSFLKRVIGKFHWLHWVLARLAWWRVFAPFCRYYEIVVRKVYLFINCHSFIVNRTKIYVVNWWKASSIIFLSKINLTALKY